MMMSVVSQVGRDITTFIDEKVLVFSIMMGFKSSPQIVQEKPSSQNEVKLFGIFLLKLYKKPKKSRVNILLCIVFLFQL